MPLLASRRRPSSAADLWGPSARWRLLGCVGDGSVAGHRRRISDAPKLVARACRHAAASSGVMLDGAEKCPVPLPRHGQWSRAWMRVRHVVGDGSAAGHRRQYGAAPKLAVLAGGPAAARAVALLIEIRPGQSPRPGYWSRVRRGGLSVIGGTVLSPCVIGGSPASKRHPCKQAQPRLSPVLGSF